MTNINELFEEVDEDFGKFDDSYEALKESYKELKDEIELMDEIKSIDIPIRYIASNLQDELMMETLA